MTQPPRPSSECDCDAHATGCALCMLLAYGYGPEPTPEQEKAIKAYMRTVADEGNDGPAYRRMVEAGLPEWGTPST